MVAMRSRRHRSTHHDHHRHHGRHHHERHLARGRPRRLGRRAGRPDRPVRRRRTTATAASSPRPSSCCARRATSPSPCPRSSADGAPPSATWRWPSGDWPRRAVRRRWPRRCTSTSPCSRRGGIAAGLPGAEATLKPHRRRGHHARVDRRRRLHQATGHGDRRRRRVPRLGPQGLRQPGARRRRVLDDVRARRRRHAGRPEHGRAGQVRRRHRPRQLGHPRHARHREPRRHDRGRLRARREGVARDGRGASSTRRCRSSPASPCRWSSPCTSAIAEAARDAAVELVAGTPRAEDPTIQRQVGADGEPPAGDVVGAGRCAAHRRRRSDAGDDHGRRRDGRQAGDRHRRRRGVRPGDGGRRRSAPTSSRRRSSAAYRDVRGAKFHPFGPEQTLDPRRPRRAGVAGRRRCSPPAHARMRACTST